jgi:hypothetical protein
MTKTTSTATIPAYTPSILFTAITENFRKGDRSRHVITVRTGRLGLQRRAVDLRPFRTLMPALLCC